MLGPVSGLEYFLDYIPIVACLAINEASD